MATEDENIVGAPPLTTPMDNGKGGLNRSWAIWFRDIYRRVAYKGGNAIDDNKNEIDEAIIDIDSTLEEVIDQVLINVDNISDVNDGVNENAEAIEVNAQETIELEERVLGRPQPDLYQEAGVSYAPGDGVIYPDTAPQKYYAANDNIAADAGPFDPSLWNEKSIFNNITRELFMQVGLVKTAMFQFTGRSTNGAATIFNNFNIDSLTRTAIGVYEGVAKQSTFFGVDVFATSNPLFSYDLAPSATTEAFHIEFAASATSGEFTIKVFEWVQGIGNKIELVPYDPDEVDDKVFVTVVADLSGGKLPPP